MLMYIIPEEGRKGDQEVVTRDIKMEEWKWSWKVTDEKRGGKKKLRNVTENDGTIFKVAL